jgi:hypothetical protein
MPGRACEDKAAGHERDGVPAFHIHGAHRVGRGCGADDRSVHWAVSREMRGRLTVGMDQGTQSRVGLASRRKA